MPHPPTITAELVQWRHDDENGRVTGFIKDSINPELYRNGAWITITYSSLTHYPQFTNTEENWLVGTTSKTYFVIYKSKEKDNEV